MKTIPYGRQYIDDDDIQAVVSVLQSDFLTTGPTISEFENAVKSYIGCKYAVAFSNGTAALHGAMFAAGIEKGDEVLVSGITFSASANCVLYVGGTPVFVDINEKTYTIDIEDLKRKITTKTKAIIAVDLCGQPCDMDEIIEIANEHSLLIISDSAHALGATYKNQKIGNIADMTMFSFHPVKHITTGEGGMITTNNEHLYKRLMLFRTHGITRDADIMDKKNNPAYHKEAWYYQQLDLGYNYRLTDIQAVLGISQMKKLPEFLKRRKEISELYEDLMQDAENITLPYIEKNRESAWHLYVIQVDNREAVFAHLRNNGILANVHYIPVYMHPYYRKNGYMDISLKNCENYFEKCISIPMYYGLTDENIIFVADKIKEAVLWNK